MTVQSKIVPHNRLASTPRMQEEVHRVLQTGRFAQGPLVGKLESRLAKEIGLPFATCVSSGTAALKLALLSLGVKRGDSVAVPAYGCVALPNAVLTCGAKPVPVDVSRDSLNLDPKRLNETAKKNRLKAIVGIHLFGSPFQVKKIISSGIPVIEDCSHGFGHFGARLPLGGQSGLAIASLYATKYLGGAEGGAILSNRPDIAEFIRDYRDYTDKLPGKNRLNEKMSDIEAALVLGRISHLNHSARERQRLAEVYTQAFQEVSQRRENFAIPSHNTKRIWYRYVIILKKMSAEEAIQKLADYGIQAARPVHEWLPQNGEFPIAENAYRHALSLPLFPGLRSHEQRRVIRAIATLWKS